jgi:hypothetical protein
MGLCCFTWNIPGVSTINDGPAKGINRRAGRVLDPEGPGGQDGPCFIADSDRCLRLRCVPPNPSWDAWNLTKLVAQRTGESTA